MASLFSSFKYSSVLSYSTLLVFTLNCIAYPSFGHANQIECNVIGHALLLAKVKGHVDKLKNLGKKATLSDALQVLIDVKNDIHIATGKNFSINESMKTVQNEIKAQGGYIPESVLNSYVKQAKKKEKKTKHHASYLAYVYSDPSLQYSIEEENALFEAKVGGKESEKEVTVPLDVAIGITAALVGVFLMALSPIPGCFYCGEELFKWGAGTAVLCRANHYMNQEKK